MAFLCEDELFHIFSYLPAKSIFKFKSLGQSFLEYTSGTHFSMKHAQNMLLKDDTCISIQRDIWNSFGNDEIHALPEEELFFGLPRSFMQFLAKVKILASSNGLFLCQSMSLEGQVELCLCNPITQTWLPIVPPTTLLENPYAVNINVFFKCINKDMDFDDYLIFLIENTPEWSQYVDIKVYLPKEGVWKAMEKSFFVGGMNMRLNMPVYLHGAIHIMSDCPSFFAKGSPYFWPYIMTYKFETGESIKLRIPKNARRGSHELGCDMRIFEWGKENSLDRSMCLVRYLKRVFTIWVLIDHESSTWRRILKIRVKGMGVKEEDPRVHGFRIINGDCLIFATEKKVYGYYFISQNFWRLKEICEHEWDSRVIFTPYSATLRPCGTLASTIPTGS